MSGRAKNTAEETAELQRLYSELPSAIAEAAEAMRAAQQSGRSAEAVPEEGDEKVDTIIKRICQLSEESGGR
jgi:methyl-accepting chemotaxis protein